MMIEEFEYIKYFVANLTSTLDVGPQNIRVGFIQSSTSGSPFNIYLNVSCV